MGSAPVGATGFVAPTWQNQIGHAGHSYVYPFGMAFAPDGTLLVTDYNNHLVKRFSTSGALLGSYGSLGSAQNQFNQPYGVAVDPNDGSFYVGDFNNSK